MNPIEYCREVAKGLVPEEWSPRVAAEEVRERELILLVNPSLHNLIRLKIEAEEVADYIKRTIGEIFTELKYHFYPSHINALLANSNLHMLVAGN